MENKHLLDMMNGAKGLQAQVMQMLEKAKGSMTTQQLAKLKGLDFENQMNKKMQNLNDIISKNK